MACVAGYIASVQAAKSAKDTPGMANTAGSCMACLHEEITMPTDFSAVSLTSLLPALPDYVVLHCISNFTFLNGASHPAELIERALALGYRGLRSEERRVGKECRGRVWRVH